MGPSPKTSDAYPWESVRMYVRTYGYLCTMVTSKRRRRKKSPICYQSKFASCLIAVRRLKFANTQYHTAAFQYLVLTRMLNSGAQSLHRDSQGAY